MITDHQQQVRHAAGGALVAAQALQDACCVEEAADAVAVDGKHLVHKQHTGNEPGKGDQGRADLGSGLHEQHSIDSGSSDPRVRSKWGMV